MFITLYYKFPPELSLRKRDSLNVISSTSSNSSSSVENDESSEKSILINPDCPVRIILEHIRTKCGFADLTIFDLCDEYGNLKNLFHYETFEYVTDKFTHRGNYFIVVFTGETNHSVPLLQLNRNNRIHAVLLSKVKRDINAQHYTPTYSDKLLPISDNMILGINGDSADMSQFSQFIAKNLQLYTVKNGYKVCQEAAAHFVRKNLADTIRTNDAYSMNLMLAGYENGHSMLYYIDNLGTSMPVPYACHGFGGIFSTSILDFYHRPNLTEQEGYELLMLCVKEIQKRLFVNLSSFQVKVVNKYGITTLPSI